MYEQTSDIADLSQDTKILKPRNLEFCRSTALIEIGGSEINECIREFPLCFTYADKTWRLCALLSAEEGSNHYVNPSSGWKANYIPSQIRAWPFNYSEDLEQLRIDREAIFNPTYEEEKFTNLYDDKDKHSSIAIDKAMKILEGFKSTRDRTRQLIDLLNNFSLLKPLRLVIQKESGISTFEGLYQIDEQQLYNLDGDALQLLHKNRALSIAYSQVISKVNFEIIQNSVSELLKMEKRQSEIQSEIGSFLSNDDGFGF